MTKGGDFRLKKLATAFMLVLGIVLLIMRFQLQQKEQLHTSQSQKLKENKANYLFETVIPKISKDAGILVASTGKNIIDSFDEKYPDKSVLKTELLDNLNGRSDESPAIAIMGDNVQGVTLNEVSQNESDNNDLVILMRNPETDEYLITIDMSENCATDERFRNAKSEALGKPTEGIKGQFADKLFYQAYEDLTRKNKTFTFWSYLDVMPDKAWYSDVFNMDSTELVNLKAYFLKYNVDLESLRSFEFLTADKIYRYEDYFGVPVKLRNGTYTKEDMPIVIISGFNLLDQLKFYPDMNSNLQNYDIEIKIENERFLTYKAQNEIFSIVIIVMFIMLFLYTHEHHRKSTK